MQNVSGEYRAAEARIVDGHEVDQLALGLRPQRVNDQNGRGLRHRLDDQHARHNRAGRKVTLKIRLVDRDVLDAGRVRVGNDIDNLVDHQERLTVRDHLHDPLNVDLDWWLGPRRLERRPGAGRIDHRPSFFLARRCRIATCFMNNRIGSAGLPPTVSPAATSRISPDLAAMRAKLPIVK